MFQIEAAGLVIRIENRFDYVHDLCAKYKTSPDRPADITVSVSEEEIRWEIENAPEYDLDRDYCESVVIYKKISNALPPFEAFVMHSSAIAVDGGAYCIAAESGVGKSTHTRFWKEALGDRAVVINGDKPICRFMNGQLMVFGSPWCGKENWQTNTSAPMRALCLLKRAQENAVYPVNAFELLGEIAPHFHLPGAGQVDMLKLMDLIDQMLTHVPVYRLCCRNDISAAETAIAFFGLTGSENKTDRSNE